MKTRFLLLFLIVVMAGAVVAGAQPAAIGPPPAGSAAAGELSIPILTGIVRQRAQTTVDETNAKLRQEGRSARVAIESLTARAPSRLRTGMLNAPNSFYVGIPYALTIKVAIPAAFDRHIHIPIEVQVFCDNWHTLTTGGNIAVRSVPRPPSIEGGNILEDILQIRNFIDSRVRSAFNAPMPASIPLPGRCFTIGAFNGGTATVSDDTVVWDIPRMHAAGLAPAQGSQRPAVIVTFDRLKRLRARRFTDSAILYEETEEIRLNAFGNYALASSVLTMREGDDVALNLPPIRLDAPTFDSLVVIGSIDQPPHNPKDSAFAVAARAQGYQTGTHVLQISKSFSEINSSTHKPMQVKVPAYELTYTVRFVDPGALSPSG